MDVPADWHQATDRILGEARPGLVVMVVGATDTGKSTFCRYLASRLAKAGVLVGLVDADVGQSTIGPPAAISGGLVGGPLAPGTMVEPAASIFVGSVSPMGHLLPCVTGTKRVADRLREFGAGAILVVDTSGLILGGAGRSLKEHKFDLLQPQVVVAIQRDRELQQLVRLWERSAGQVIAVRPSPAAVPCTPAERRSHRGQRFAELLRDAGILTLPLRRVAWREARTGPRPSGRGTGGAGKSVEHARSARRTPGRRGRGGDRWAFSVAGGLQECQQARRRPDHGSGRSAVCGRTMWPATPRWICGDHGRAAAYRLHGGRGGAPGPGLPTTRGWGYPRG